jgi:lysophospholipase L1-like esterase
MQVRHVSIAGMTRRLNQTAQNLGLLLGSLTLTLVVVEAGFRILDPTPYFTDSEINNTEHGNLSMYDASLGWKGVPNGKAEFVTRNNKIWLSHNSQGFRDIEHDYLSDGDPAIVFLGDSFTWGYEVEFDEMFVNQLRNRFPRYELFNLAHRGYGTDQSLLTFMQWQNRRPIELVVLMFSENDVYNNNSAVSDDKPKPKYRIDNDGLVLTGVPVPRLRAWTNTANDEVTPEVHKFALKDLFYSSHLINNMRIRYKLFRERMHTKIDRNENDLLKTGQDYRLTVRILEALRNEVMQRGSRLVVVFIPSKREIDDLDNSMPYQKVLMEFCDQLGIDCLDLAPDFSKPILRTYYRQGMHWNARGHEVAAEALIEYLKKQITR